MGTGNRVDTARAATTRAARHSPAEHALRVPDAHVTCRPAASPSEFAAHFAIRHEVFVLEQQVFAHTERDNHDLDAGVVHLLARYGEVPAGAVRLFPLDGSGLWQGDRLCVLPGYRIHGIGAPLVRCAVATAGACGGREMVAHIQLPNVSFFTHLGWQRDGDVELYAGLEHQPMRIDLPDSATGDRQARELARRPR